MDLHRELPGCTRFVQLFALAIASSVVPGLIGLLSLKYEYDSTNALSAYFALLALVLYSVRNRLELRISPAQGHSHDAKLIKTNYWRAKVTQHISVTPITAVQVQEVIEAGITGDGVATRHWYAIVFVGEGREVRTLHYGDRKRAQGVKQQIDDFLAADATQPFVVGGDESLLATVIYVSIALVIYSSRWW